MPRKTSFILPLLTTLALAGCSPGAGDKPSAPEAGTSLTGSFVLALSWEPAFCETKPGVPECKAQTATSQDARQFSLHGLWPEDTYCNVAAAEREADERGRWSKLPAVTLPADLKERLEVVMPGKASDLDRHEWTKHGTCSGGDAATYYAVSLALVDAVNASGLPELFMESLGGVLSAKQIGATINDAFGKGVSSRVTLECVTDGSRRLISGIRFALAGTLDDTPDLGAAALAAAPRSGGCKSGVIDPAGLQ